MKIDDLTISKSIIESYFHKFLASLKVDAALVGAGPSNLIAGYYLAKAGMKSVIFESKLAPGGGMWGGAMMFNEGVIQSDALPIINELGISYNDRGGGYYTIDTIEATSTIISKCVQQGTIIFNLIKVTDVLFDEKNGAKRVSGLVLNWSPTEHLGLFVDPLSIKATYVVDGTGHPADICSIITKKIDAKLNTRTGGVIGEMSLRADAGEQFTVSNTKMVFPGLYVVGMAANNVFGGPRMGPIFGGMIMSGKKAAEIIFSDFKNTKN